MARVGVEDFLGQADTLFESGTTAGLTDRELLERFVSRRDAAGEAAFAALVARHGPMVQGLCRQLVGDRHLAEDAFQAVFLVLARKAPSLRDPDLLGHWLYGVAVRTARKAKARLVRQRKREEGDRMSRPEPETPSLDAARAVHPPTFDRDDVEALHDELNRLPGKFSAPVVLCYFEGLTLDEAARRLRCPVGTARSRIARAREKLRDRLTRRGVAAPAALLGAVLSSESASAHVALNTCRSTSLAAARFVAGEFVSTSAAGLAIEVLRAMSVRSFAAVAASILLVGTLLTGAGFLSLRATGAGFMNVPDPRVPPSARGDREEPEPAAAPSPSERMTVKGQVLDHSGRPVAGAHAAVIARPKAPGRGGEFSEDGPAAIGQAPTNDRGEFRLDAPRTSSSRYFEVGIIAGAPGHGVGWADLNPDAAEPSAQVRLRPEQVIHGRLIDPGGKPASGVCVRVMGMGVTADGACAGPRLWGNLQREVLPCWPEPATTDEGGHFTLHGIGQDLDVFLTIEDERFARRNDLHIRTDSTETPREVTLTLAPAKILSGRVIYADTRKPVPGSVVNIAASEEQFGSMQTTEFRADDEGRFRANPSPGNYFRVTAYAPPDMPYLNIQKALAWPVGAAEQTVDLELPRGVLVPGKVTEGESGKPVAGATVMNHPRLAGMMSSGLVAGWSAVVPTNTDGVFQVTVAPGHGYLLIHGSTDDYVLREIDQMMLLRGRPGGDRNYTHGLIAYDIKTGDETLEVAIELRRGNTVAGTVVGPDGQPVADAAIISRLFIAPLSTTWRSEYQGKVRDGRFELHGLDPDRDERVYFLDARRALGATVKLSGKSVASGPLTVRLEPCGSARARLVDPRGKSVAGYRMWELCMVVTSGLPRLSRTAVRQEQLAADEDVVGNIDRLHYGSGPTSDTEGRVVFPVLIPHADYRLYDFTTMNQPEGAKVRKEFVVKPGEDLDLGDVLIEGPRQ